MFWPIIGDFHPPPRFHIRSLSSEHSGRVSILHARLWWELWGCCCCCCLLNWTEWRQCGGRGSACFNNACVLEATAGQRSLLQRCFKDAPQLTHVQDPIKNRKVVGQNSELQRRASRALFRLLPIGTFYMHLLSRCSHRQWISKLCILKKWH